MNLSSIQLFLEKTLPRRINHGLLEVCIAPPHQSPMVESLKGHLLLQYSEKRSPVTVDNRYLTNEGVKWLLLRCPDHVNAVLDPQIDLEGWHPLYEVISPDQSKENRNLLPMRLVLGKDVSTKSIPPQFRSNGVGYIRLGDEMGHRGSMFLSVDEGGTYIESDLDDSDDSDKEYSQMEQESQDYPSLDASDHCHKDSKIIAHNMQVISSPGQVHEKEDNCSIEFMKDIANPNMHTSTTLRSKDPVTTDNGSPKQTKMHRREAERKAIQLKQNILDASCIVINCPPHLSSLRSSDHIGKTVSHSHTPKYVKNKIEGKQLVSVGQLDQCNYERMCRNEHKASNCSLLDFEIPVSNSHKLLNDALTPKIGPKKKLQQTAFDSSVKPKSSSKITQNHTKQSVGVPKQGNSHSKDNGLQSLNWKQVAHMIHVDLALESDETPNFRIAESKRDHTAQSSPIQSVDISRGALMPAFGPRKSKSAQEKPKKTVQSSEKDTFEHKEPVVRDQHSCSMPTLPALVPGPISPRLQSIIDENHQNFHPTSAQHEVKRTLHTITQPTNENLCLTSEEKQRNMKYWPNSAPSSSVFSKVCEIRQSCQPTLLCIHNQIKITLVVYFIIQDNSNKVGFSPKLLGKAANAKAQIPESILHPSSLVRNTEKSKAKAVSENAQRFRQHNEHLSKVGIDVLSQVLFPGLPASSLARVKAMKARNQAQEKMYFNRKSVL